MSDERVSQLEENIQSVRARERRGLPIDRWMMIAGAAMIVVGLVVIVYGWVGASRTPYVFEQIPYLISGGIFGLALAVTGGLLYFAYWMTQQVRSTREGSERTRDALERIESLLAAGVGAGPNGARAAGAETKAKERTNGKPFVITGKGTMFHRPDCVVVAGKAGVTAVAGTEKGLVPCKICDPSSVSA